MSLVNCIPVFIVSDPIWAAQFTRSRHPVRRRRREGAGRRDHHASHARQALRRSRRRRSTAPISSTPAATPISSTCSAATAWPARRSARPKRCRASSTFRWTPTTSTSAPAISSRSRRTTKSASSVYEGTGFGGVPMELELRLSVEDSPNSAGVVVDAIRCCKLARDAGLAGPIEPVCAWTMKHPPVQMHDPEALAALEEFVRSATPWGGRPGESWFRRDENRRGNAHKGSKTPRKCGERVIGGPRGSSPVDVLCSCFLGVLHLAANYVLLFPGGVADVISYNIAHALNAFTRSICCPHWWRISGKSCSSSTSP